MSLREIVLIIIIAVLSLVALVRPRAGLYGYIWFSLMRPDYFAYATPQSFYSPVLCAAILLGSLRYFLDFPVVFLNPVSRALILFQIPVAISVYLAIIPELCYQRFGEYERMILIVLLVPVLIRTIEQLRIVFFIIALSLGFIGFKFGLGAMTGGYHIADGYAGLEGNALAIELVIGICFCWYLRLVVQSRILKLALLALIFGSASAVVMTTSRGGTLAMATAFLLMIARSPHKVRYFVLLALLIVPSAYLFRTQFFARMETLQDPTQESSSRNRLIMYQATLRAAEDYPLHGVGFGNLNFIRIYPFYVSDERVRDLGIKVHETYLQVLIDTGIFGLLLFVYLLFGTIFRMWRSQRWCLLRHPGTEIYPLAIFTSLIAAAQYGLTGGIERYAFLYIPLMCGAAWYGIQNRKTEPEPAEAPRPAEVVAPA